MDRDRSLREHLKKLLDWEDAQVSVDRAIDGIPPRLRGQVPHGAAHSADRLAKVTISSATSHWSLGAG